MDNLNAFLDRMTALLSIGSGPLTVQALQGIIAKAREPEPADHWSPWLDCGGRRLMFCPLPPETEVEILYSDGPAGLFGGPADRRSWSTISVDRFRYRADNPAGWLSRGDWIPPAELWDEGCPVRCEWQYDDGVGTGRLHFADQWSRITHIRLVAREAKAGLPEGWKRTRHGDLVSPSGRMIFARENVDQYGGGDVIRQAVDAWLAGDGR